MRYGSTPSPGTTPAPRRPTVPELPVAAPGGRRRRAGQGRPTGTTTTGWDPRPGCRGARRPGGAGWDRAGSSSPSEPRPNEARAGRVIGWLWRSADWRTWRQRGPFGLRGRWFGFRGRVAVVVYVACRPGLAVGAAGTPPPRRKPMGNLRRQEQTPGGWSPRLARLQSFPARSHASSAALKPYGGASVPSCRHRGRSGPAASQSGRTSDVGCRPGLCRGQTAVGRFRDTYLSTRLRPAMPPCGWNARPACTRNTRPCIHGVTLLHR